MSKRYTYNEARCHVIPNRLLIAAATLKTRAERNNVLTTALKCVSALLARYPAVVAVTPLKKMENVVRFMIPCFERLDDMVGTLNSTNSFRVTDTLSR
jgi:hypothetical protein